MKKSTCNMNLYQNVPNNRTRPFMFGNIQSIYFHFKRKSHNYIHDQLMRTGKVGPHSLCSINKDQKSWSSFFVFN